VIVLTLGTFDLLHAGHIALFRRCRSLAGPTGRVVVGLNTDAFVERYKGESPVIGYADREACLAALRDVDVVLPNAQDDGSINDVLDATQPDLIAIGWDWRGRDYLGQIGIGNGLLVQRKIRLVYLPYTPGAAGPTSAIKARIAGTTALRPQGEVRA
jgi:cytidyltransferase-like protein